MHKVYASVPEMRTWDHLNEWLLKLTEAQPQGGAVNHNGGTTNSDKEIASIVGSHVSQLGKSAWGLKFYYYFLSGNSNIARCTPSRTKKWYNWDTEVMEGRKKVTDKIQGTDEQRRYKKDEKTDDERTTKITRHQWRRKKTEGKKGESTRQRNHHSPHSGHVLK